MQNINNARCLQQRKNRQQQMTGINAPPDDPALVKLAVFGDRRGIFSLLEMITGGQPYTSTNKRLDPDPLSSWQLTALLKFFLRGGVGLVEGEVVVVVGALRGYLMVNRLFTLKREARGIQKEK